MLWNLFRDQPCAFPMIFMIELWERFGFYTLQGVLALYFIRQLGYSDLDFYYTFAAYCALVYGMVPIGGYLGDHVLGTKRTIVLGLIVLALGYSALAIADNAHVFYALALICVGNGLFKANPSNLLAQCYEEQDSRIDSAFTLYYMAVNLGSIVALFLGPLIASHFGYAPVFFLSAFGLLLGLLNYARRYHTVAHINTHADRRRIGMFQWALIILGICALTLLSAYLLQHPKRAQQLLYFIIAATLVFYVYYMSKENKSTAMRMLVAFVLMLEAVVFFALYQQMPTSLNLFALNNVSPSLLGIPIDPQSFQALNPIWIVIMSPVLASFYHRFNAKSPACSMPYKFALGMTLCAGSFFILFLSRYFYTGHGMVSSFWLILSYLFQSLGELLISALGIAMIAALVPAHILGFVMGMWFLTFSVGSFLGASIASYSALPQGIKPGLASLFIYTDVFALIGLITLFCALCMWCIAPLLTAKTQERR